MNERTADATMEACKRVQAARNNLLASMSGRLEPHVAGQLISGAVLLLDAAAEWLTGDE